MLIHFDRSGEFQIQLRENVILSYQNKLLTLLFNNDDFGREKRHIVVSKMAHIRNKKFDF